MKSGLRPSAGGGPADRGPGQGQFQDRCGSFRPVTAKPSLTLRSVTTPPYICIYKRATTTLATPSPELSAVCLRCAWRRRRAGPRIGKSGIQDRFTKGSITWPNQLPGVAGQLHPPSRRGFEGPRRGDRPADRGPGRYRVEEQGTASEGADADARTRAGAHARTH